MYSQTEENSETLPTGYDNLPDSIKAIISPNEYRWMNDDTREHLIEIETEPEW